MSPLKLHEIPNHKINDSTEALLPSSEYKETNHKNDDTNNKEFKKSEFPININSNNNSEFSMPETEYISNSNYPSIISSPNTNFTNSKISQAFESFLIFNESLYKGMNESFIYLLETKDSLMEKIKYKNVKNNNINNNNRKTTIASNKRKFITTFIYTLIILIIVSISYQELELLTYNDIDINSYNSNNYSNSRNKKNSMLKNYSIMYSSKIKNRLGISVKRSDENYYFEYINSKFYLENPSLHGINPFNTTETVERLMSRFPYRQKKFTSNDLDIIKRDDKEEEEEEKMKTKEKEIEMKEKEDALRKEMEIEFELRKEMEEKIDKEVKEELSKEKEKIAQKEKEDAKKKEEETEKEKEKEEENEKDKEVKDKDESAVKDKQKEQDDKSNEDIKEKEEEKTELSNLKKISANPEDGKSDNNEPIIDSEQKISKEALKDEYLEKLKDLKNSKESLNDSEKNIFQMWVKINGGNFSSDDNIIDDELDINDLPNSWQRQSWIDKNPNYNYRLYTSFKKYKNEIKENFKDLPEVLVTFELLPKVILKSDFGRYLLVYLFGGAYGDIDTLCQKPIDDWYDNKADFDIGFLAGVEEDINEDNWKRRIPRRLQFTQWTFKSKKHHPVLALLIANIIKITFKAQFDNKLRAWTHEYKTVNRKQSVPIMEWTGPGAFTDTIYEYLNMKVINENYPLIYSNLDNSIEQHAQIYGPGPDDENSANLLPVSWRAFTGMEHPVIVDDVAILPKRGFRAPLECGDFPYCYITHYFTGTWRKNNGN